MSKSPHRLYSVTRYFTLRWFIWDFISGKIRLLFKRVRTSHKSFARIAAAAKERLVTYFKNLHPSRKFQLILYILLGLLVPAVSSTMNTNHQLQVEQASKQATIIKLQNLNQALLKLQAQKADSDTQLQQKAASEADLKAQVDSLNKQLQSKKASQIAQVAPQPTGFGGNFSGYGFSNPYAFGNCTFWVATHIHVPDNLGNANTWAYWAQQDGYAVGSMPRVGSVAQTSAGYFGHVAIVIAVSGGQIEVSEMNVRGFDVVDEAWYPVPNFKYIYF